MTKRRGWLTIAVVAGAASVLSAQRPTFTAKTEQVRVDVLVTDHGKPVDGLKSADFDVVDNGVAQTVALLDYEKMPINAILTLDMSGSVAGPAMDELRRAGDALVGALNKDDRAALVAFSDVVSLNAPLTSDLASVKAAIDRASSSGATSVIDAAYAGLMVGESDSGRALLIVFSDGLDTASWLTSQTVMDTAKRSDAVVYAVSVGRLPAQTFLRDVSQVTGGSLFEVESMKNVGATFLKVLDEFRRRYVLSYVPAGVTKAGWHQIQVRIKGRNVTIKARPGYLIGPS